MFCSPHSLRSNVFAIVVIASSQAVRCANDLLSDRHRTLLSLCHGARLNLYAVSNVSLSLDRLQSPDQFSVLLLVGQERSQVVSRASTPSSLAATLESHSNGVL
jgi:hypothetical protein